ncbi:MAG: hypothetical protein C5B57_00365 [Blastocatellia bacterium]|nr:MAG: hypothetical protein C5B57_00365 [Blastocatellia bacterium]
MRERDEHMLARQHPVLAPAGFVDGAVQDVASGVVDLVRRNVEVINEHTGSRADGWRQADAERNAAVAVASEVATAVPN